MDRKGIITVGATTAITALVTIGIGYFVSTLGQGVEAAEEDRIKAVIAANQVISKEEVAAIKGSVTSLDATQKAMLEVQNKILDALLSN